MALTRKYLKELLANSEDRDELIDQIIDMHAETVAGLKAEIAKYSEAAEEARRIEAEIKQLKERPGREDDVDENGVPWKNRYESIVAEYEAAKVEGAKQDAYNEKAKAFRAMLLQEGVKYSLVDIIVRGSGDIINSMEMQDGKVRDFEGISAAIRSEYKDFISKSSTTRQARTAPATRESIMGIADRSERLAAMQQHPELFRTKE